MHQDRPNSRVYPAVFGIVSAVLLGGTGFGLDTVSLLSGSGHGALPLRG